MSGGAATSGAVLGGALASPPAQQTTSPQTGATQPAQTAQPTPYGAMQPSPYTYGGSFGGQGMQPSYGTPLGKAGQMQPMSFGGSPTGVNPSSITGLLGLL